MEKDNKWLWFGVATLILVGMVYFSDTGKIIDSLGKADLLPLIPALVFGMAVFPVWANTWYQFLKKMGLDLSYLYTLRLFMAGSFMNSVTPLGQFGGEPFMAYVINQNTESGYERSLSAVLSADIVNALPGFSFVIGGTFYMLFFKSVNDLVLQLAYVSTVVMMLGGALVYVLWFRAGLIEGYVFASLEKVSDFLGRGESLVDRAEDWLDELEESFDMIGENPRHLLETAAVAHLSFLFQVLSLYFIMFSLGMDPDFTPLYFVLAVGDLAQFSPTPGGTGAYEAMMAGVLNVLMGVPPHLAIIIGVLFRLTTYWPGLLIGYISLATIDKQGGPR
ncbi:MAG: YbhN family protein [Candidatus Nanohaloarchaea archaeon]